MGKSATLLPRGDDLSSDPIDITVGLPFNRVIFDTAYVRKIPLVNLVHDK